MLPMLIRGLSFVKTLSSHLLDQASGKMRCVSCGFPGCDVTCERNEVPEPPKPQLQYFLLHSMFKSMLGSFLFASANIQYSMLALSEDTSSSFEREWVEHKYVY